MRVLLADNALLQAALADVRSSLSHDRPSSAGASGDLALTALKSTPPRLPSFSSCKKPAEALSLKPSSILTPLPALQISLKGGMVL